MLFAMSTIDQEKFQELVVSLSASFGVFEGSSTSLLEGSMVSSGVESLNELAQEYTTMGLNFEGASEVISPEMEDFKDQQIVEMYSESEKIQEDIEQKLEETGISDQVEIEITAQYVQLTLSGSLLFESASADVKPESLPFVEKIGGILSGYSGNIIEVIGHTDNVPMSGNARYADNIDLSMGRAKTIALYLVNNNGMI
jgi:chemotaxis protein MotB